MRLPVCSTVGLAVCVVLLAAGTARAADFCVAIARDGCTAQATLAEALESARATADLDRVFVGEIDEQAITDPFADEAGKPVTIIGSGALATKLRAGDAPAATVRLSDPRSSLAQVSVTAPGAAAGVAVQLLAGAAIADSTLVGAIEGLTGGAPDATARALRLFISTTGRPALAVDGLDLLAESIDAEVQDAATGLSVTCTPERDGVLTVAHLTLAGKLDAAGTTACAGPRKADLTISNSVLELSYQDPAGPFTRDGNGTITTAWSVHPDDPADATASDRLSAVTDPGFVSDADHRLRPDSPLVDAGDPAPLAPTTPVTAGEGLTDVAGFARIVDGAAHGAVRRDVGAHELQPPPLAPPPDNVLANPGAESSADSLPGWSGPGSFETAAFGADRYFPGLMVAAALGTGARFFAAGTSADSVLMQRIDVAASAASIDSGGASAVLSGLLGGYAGDADEIRLDAIFRDPAGVPLGSLALSGPTPAQRGNATNLLARSAAGAIPQRTRAIDVQLTAHRVAGTYTDGYADNLALTLSVPGVPIDGPIDPTKPVIPGLKPFAGVAVLSANPTLSSRSAVRVNLGCESATVGRCTGRFELWASPRRRRSQVRIAGYGRFSLRPGESRTVIVKLHLKRRRDFLSRRSFRAKLVLTARDAQGLERRKHAPVRVRRLSSVKRRR